MDEKLAAHVHDKIYTNVPVVNPQNVNPNAALAQYFTVMHQDWQLATAECQAQ